jgi:hypothetical protein
MADVVAETRPAEEATTILKRASDHAIATAASRDAPMQPTGCRAGLLSASFTPISAIPPRPSVELKKISTPLPHEQV